MRTSIFSEDSRRMENRMMEIMMGMCCSMRMPSMCMSEKKKKKRLMFSV